MQRSSNQITGKLIIRPRSSLLSISHYNATGDISAQGMGRGTETGLCNPHMNKEVTLYHLPVLPIIVTIYGLRNEQHEGRARQQKKQRAPIATLEGASQYMEWTDLRTKQGHKANRL
jgi:hypothetical protein